MRRRSKYLVLALTASLLVLAAAGFALRSAAPAAAQTSASYDLTWNVVGGGAGPMASTHYLVHSTAGQSGASPPYSAGGGYVVSGGYWFGSGAPDVVHLVYLPVIARGYP